MLYKEKVAAWSEIHTEYIKGKWPPCRILGC